MDEHTVTPDSWSSIAAHEPGSVLLQRAPSLQGSGRSLLFSQPYQIIEAWQPNEVAQALAKVEGLLSQGFHLAGYLAYEAGFALEPSLRDLSSCATHGEPLVWLGCYRSPQTRQDSFPTESSTAVTPPVQLEYSSSQEGYERQVEVVRELIARGETYQLNLTMEAQWLSQEPVAELYERLLRAQPVPYAALLHPHSDCHILSLSPELFLQRSRDRIRTRPMKGTASPGLDSAENAAQAVRLQSSEKERAENVMIVDLLRSDLGRICRAGSVHVTRLFEVERYPTVLQMISEVEG